MSRACLVGLDVGAAEAVDGLLRVADEEELPGRGRPSLHARRCPPSRSRGRTRVSLWSGSVSWNSSTRTWSNARWKCSRTSGSVRSEVSRAEQQVLEVEDAASATSPAGRPRTNPRATDDVLPPRCARGRRGVPPDGPAASFARALMLGEDAVAPVALLAAGPLGRGLTCRSTYAATPSSGTCSIISACLGELLDVADRSSSESLQSVRASSANARASVRGRRRARRRPRRPLERAPCRAGLSAPPARGPAA